MKVQAKVNKNLIIEFEADATEVVFEKIASIQDIFGCDVCGKCQKDRIKFVVREDKDKNKYYSLDCLDCKARLSFGVLKDNKGLFVKRKDKEDKWISNGGWRRWSTTTQSYE